MGIPTLITVSGTIRDKGNGVAGRLVWASNTLVRDNATNDVMLPQEIEVTVGSDGEFSLTVPATNDPGFSPTGWTWEVRPHFPHWVTPFSVAIPYNAAGGALNFSAIAPVPPDGDGQLYALASHTHSGGGGGAVTTVAGRTGDVVLSAVDISNSTSVGRSILTAADAAAVRTAAGAEVSGAATSAVAAHVAASDPHTQYGRIYVWNGSAYVVSTTADIYIGPGDPGAIDGIWIDSDA